MEVPALKDKKTGKPSYTLTAFVIGAAFLNIKLLLSGVQITETIKLESFSGVDYAAAMASLGSIYVLRKNKTIKEDKKDE